LKGFYFQASDDIILTGDKTKVKAQTVAHASKKLGLEVNKEKIKYMMISHHQTARKNDESIKIANKSIGVQIY
jgi:hypothetical protein